MKKIIISLIILVAPMIVSAQIIDDAFGVNLHLRNRFYESDWEAAITSAQAAGVQWGREEFSWDAIEPADNSYNWTQYDSVVAKYNEKNIKVLGLLTYSTQWASTNPGSYEYGFYQPNIDAWKDYVYQVALHYQGKVSAWEIWNEPNTINFWKNSQEEYINLFTEAAKQIRLADPSAIIVLGGLSGADASYLDSVYSSIENKDYFDAVAIHPYRQVDNDYNYSPEKTFDGLNTLTTDLANVTCIMKKHDDSDKPVWLTEYGYTTYVNGVAEYDQASLLMRGYAIALANPQVAKIFWYTFRDDAANNEYLESSFGLTNNDLTAKNSYEAYNFLEEKMSGQEYQASLLANETVLDDFNKKRGWQFTGTENANGQITEDYHNKLKVYYHFESESTNSFLPVSRKIKLPDNAKAISFKAKGSNDTTYLRVRVVDRTGETFQYNLGYMPAEYTTYHILLGNFNNSWNGNENGVLDYPIYFDSFVLDDNPDGSQATGNAYFNNLTSSVKGNIFINQYEENNTKNYLIWTTGSSGTANIYLADAKKIKVYSVGEETKSVSGKKHYFKITVATQPKWVQVTE